MASSNALAKKVWRDLNEIRNHQLAQGKFIYESSPFDYSEDSLPGDCIKYIIVGQLWLTSKIYQNHALRIEIRLPGTYPIQPPEVVIMTPIYHPNVNENSK